MKVLWLAPYPPAAPLHGGRIRLLNLLRAVAREHSVDLWCVDDGSHQAPLPSEFGPDCYSTTTFCASTGTRRAEKLAALLNPLPEAVSAACVPALSDALARLQPGSYDVAVLEQAHMYSYARGLENRAIPYVLDAQNVESWLMRQLSSRAPRRRAQLRMRVDSHKFARCEARLFAGADRVVAMSDSDARRIRAMSAGADVRVVVSGVDVEYFQWQDHSKARRPRIVMTGTLGYMPNLDAAYWMHQEILPRLREIIPDAELSLVGHAAPEALLRLHDPSKGFLVTGAVADIRPHVQAADAFVIPLRMGSGTRLKAVEALASGVPIVSTALGVEGLGLVDRQHVMLADDAQGLAEATALVLRDESLRHRISHAGRDLAVTRFSWDRLGPTFTRVLTETAAANRRPIGTTGGGVL